MRIIRNLLTIILLCCSAVVQAQHAVGQWQVYPTKSTTPGLVYEGISDIVYYISGTNLFYYDKNTNEIGTLNSGNYLSDTGIKNIYYNYDKGYLMVVYDNSNIDLIYDDFTVVNIPDIKNTIMMESKVINDVAFGDDKIYLATDFGMVVLNDEKYEVFESYKYNKKLNKLTIAGNFLITLIDNQLYVAPITKGMYQFTSSWHAVNMNDVGVPNKITYLYAIDDNHILYSFDEKTYIFDVADQTFTLQNTSLYYARFINRSKDGHMVSFENNIRFLSSQVTDDNMIQVLEIKSVNDAAAQKGYYSSFNNDNSIWCCSASGISHFTISGSSLTWLITPTGYNTSSVTTPHGIQYHEGKIYVKNYGPYNYSTDQTGNTVISVCDLNNNYEWTVLSLDNVTRHYGSSPGALRASYNLSFDPDSSNVFYIGSWFDGLHKFNGSKYIGNYNKNNAPLTQPWAMLAEFSQFDKDGNLWIIMVNNTLTENAALACLPADKKIIDPAASSPSDWTLYDIGAKISYWNALLVCKHSPYVFVIHGKQVSPTRLTVFNRNTGESRVFSTFTDQDGGSFGSGVLNFLTAEEDNNGSVWIGTTSGPIVLNNLSNIMNNNYRCTRVKVPRNDGTNYADYLLEDEAINSIVVDGDNRKWLGTTSSGVYLVSETGTEILENHTTENSLLPANKVYDMAMNNATGELFVATELGVASYRSDVSEVAPDYDNVVAFPNPVRPDYTGWITVQGLMENSLVKITDVAGNLFCEGYSNGGTFTWDGRTASGERVKTGIYLVYASQSGGNSGVVTKIMVVN